MTYTLPLFRYDVELERSLELEQDDEIRVIIPTDTETLEELNRMSENMYELSGNGRYSTICSVDWGDFVDGQINPILYSSFARRVRAMNHCLYILDEAGLLRLVRRVLDGTIPSTVKLRIICIGRNVPYYTKSGRKILLGEYSITKSGTLECKVSRPGSNGHPYWPFERHCDEERRQIQSLFPTPTTELI